MTEIRHRVLGMTRTDPDGRDFQLWIEGVLCRKISVEELRTACGLTKARYYGEPRKDRTGRREKDDFPDAEEIRLAAEYFGFNQLRAMADFGLLAAGDVAEYVSDGDPMPPPSRIPSWKGVKTATATPSRIKRNQPLARLRSAIRVTPAHDDRPL